MCGIVGYIGNKDAYQILIKGLHRLEYRGYDSAGVALINKNKQLNVYKTKGKVAYLEDFASDKDTSGTIGIAHTRWATHGEPTNANAHPHYSQSEKLAMIHNGIIENYAVLKEQLIAKGYTFQSSTDTEVLIQLIEFIKTIHKTDLFTAVQMALNQIVGAYAIAILDKENPDTIIAARKSSPLVIGVGEDEYFLASDATPIIEYTNKVVYLNDEEIAIIKRGEPLKIKTISNIEKTPQIQQLELSLSQLEKGNYNHFMLKEIFEQAKSLTDCMRGRINTDVNNIALSGFIDHKEKFLNAKRIIITACGTSWHAGLIGMYAIEEFARIPVEVEYSSEFRYRKPVINKDDIVIAISQSGETADTLAAIELAKKNGAFIFGICNVVGSSIARATDSGCYTHVGPEIGVASTKAFTAQVLVLLMLALSIAKEKKAIEENHFLNILHEMTLIPDKIKTILKINDNIEKFSQIFTYASNFIYLGRGYNYPIALEGALKLKEISYIHAEGYPAAEMKHGPIALINAEMPVVVIATNAGMYEKVVSNIQEIKARKGKVIAIITEGDEVVRKLADYCIQIPETKECLVPLLASIPLQLLAYHIAVVKGCDVDQPRNLAKSVTVE
ncbi:MAG: glutamine--fructose-6-phosphate transaminase (isomerizing) [Paludibacteraceae bacterium]|nr:glutamine--fructose-6-phosphate transaminase (isomerizing) [Paludibacteraceae bacterium]HOU68856.1 glutamine--fructose-6-phosphate transaminase (isomerizing) [Paludibacteraceae bacterium]HQF50612.1 glutamine--fructose-6-phosphate transaminase (isomerizing) [Paludibacteraceae bacterium]HQJ90182.1 glutamine--fructose-6-phosphate transaminase (isomerizing) [Paludibacteraceae bacterium]